MLAKDLVKIFPGKPKTFNNVNIPYKKKIDDKLVEKIAQFIKFSTESLSKIGLNKTIVGLSGGIDSSITAALCAKALGKDNVFAVHINFQRERLAEDVKFVSNIAKHIGIDCKIIQADELFEKYLDTIKIENKLSLLHIRTRFINNIIFQIADNKFASVVDTTDKSEKVTGRHAECFYGHFAPIIDLYKSELCDLVDFMGLPQEIKTRQPGCPELLDINAFGVEWKELDPVIYLLAEKKISVDKISEEYGIDKEWLTKLKNRIDKQPYRTETKKLFLT